jgi:transcriptional regulator with XRE-family HTH domain
MTDTRAKRLQSAMNRRGLTKLSAMAATMGVTESAVSRWRHGGKMTVDNVTVLCDVLDISMDWLLLGRGHMEQHKPPVLQVHPHIAQAVARMKPHAREHLSMFLTSIQDDSG